MPISCIGTISSQQFFEQFHSRSNRFERVKTKLKEKVNKIAKLSDKFDEVCEEAIRRIQDFQRVYRAKLQSEWQILKGKVEISIAETEKKLVNPEYVTQDELANSYWEFINEPVGDFKAKSISTMRKKEKDFVMQFQNRLYRLITIFQEGQKDRIAANADIILEELELNPTTVKKIKKREAAQKVASLSNLASQIMTATLICYVPFCFCWPLVGLWQAVNRERLDPSLCGCHIWTGIYTCCLPTFLCCVGAALNRRAFMLSAGLETNFLLELSLFSMHVWNACLVCQETVTQAKIPHKIFKRKKRISS